MNIHLLSPGVSSAKISGGGTTLFRAIATLLANHAPVFAYERASTDIAWRHNQVTVRPWCDPQRAVDGVLDSVRPGDTVVKVSGALPGRWDMVADIQLAHLRQLSPKTHLAYVDADGPSRLPILQYTGSYLDTTLNAADAVILCAGGARAVHAYRTMTSAPVIPLTVAIAWYGVPAPSEHTNQRNTDVAAVFGADTRRQVRVIEISTALARAGLTVTLAGPTIEGLPAGVTNAGFVDGHTVSEIVAGSRFSLSLLREDVSGFADIHPCRVVESARLGSMIVSDVFPGLARLLTPGRELIPLESDPDKLCQTLRQIDEQTRRTATRRAYERVQTVAWAESRTFISAALGRVMIGAQWDVANL